MEGIIRANVTDLFNGQSDIVLFNEISDYSKASGLSSLTGAKSLGQIVQDSTEWTGDEPAVDNLLDEQGDVITASVTAGTLGFGFQMADTSPETFAEFLKGSGIDYTTPDEDNQTPWEKAEKVVGFGTQLPTMTRPIMVVNDEMNKSLLFPKAKITSNLTLEDGLWRIAVTVVAENIDMAGLKTGMLIKGKTAYTNAIDSFKAELVKGGDVILNGNISVPEPISISAASKINLNGHTITSTAEGAALKFITGESTIEDGTVIGASGKNANAICVETGATLTINGGTYSVGKDATDGGNDCIYSTGGKIVITGGTFSSEGEFRGQPWVLNIKNDAKGTGSIKCKGGRFYKFNPAQPNTDDDTTYVEDGFQSVQDGDYYKVVPQ